MYAPQVRVNNFEGGEEGGGGGRGGRGGGEGGLLAVLVDFKLHTI